MRRWLLRIALGGLLFIALAFSALWLALRPPTTPVPERRDLVLRGGTRIDPGRERAVGDVAVREGRLVLSPSEKARGAEVIDVSGAYLLPGLVDLHVHHPPVVWVGHADLFDLLFLAHGVTTVRDTGNFDGTIFDRRERIRSGGIPGPRLFACGPILDGDPPSVPFYRAVADAEAGREAVRELAERGADCIKAYTLLSADALAGIRAEAERRGLPLIGHVPVASRIEEAGLVDVQHLTGVPPIPPDADLGDILGWMSAFAHGWAEVDATRIAAVVRVSAERGIAHTPTLALVERVRQLTTGSDPAADPVMALLPRVYRELLFPAGFEAMEADLTALGAALPRMRLLVRRLHQANVPLRLGTDSLVVWMVPGASLHEEMAQFVAAGLSPEEVWALATRGAGEALGAAPLGQLVEGAPADLLIFGEDPTRDLANLDSLEAVIADGRFYGKTQLAAAAARHREALDRWLNHALIAAAFRLLAPEPERAEP